VHSTVPKRLPLAVRSIFHPTDFSKESLVAFAHALKLALACRAELRIMHIETRPGETTWEEFPHVRETLTRWDLLPPGSDRRAVARLGLRVDKIVATGTNPARSILEYLETRPADLLVLATHQSGGLAGWLGNAIAEPLARHARMLTLFIPPLIEGFVSRESGEVQLRQVLIPVDQQPDPRTAIDAAAGLGLALGCRPMAFTLLHVGAEADMPKVTRPAQEGWTWNSVSQPGEVVEQIFRVATELPADLIAMGTQGHKGFLDALRGSTTERVLRDARCPVLAVPVAELAAESVSLGFSPVSPAVVPA
jgi:nucleotide-binding universal stress UspA family protein